MTPDDFKRLMLSARTISDPRFNLITRSLLKLLRYHLDDEWRRETDEKHGGLGPLLEEGREVMDLLEEPPGDMDEVFTLLMQLVTHMLPKDWYFFGFAYGDDGRTAYMSNGQREDCIRIMNNFLRDVDLIDLKPGVH